MTTGRNNATMRIIGGVLFGLIIAALWIASMAHTAYAQQATGFLSNWLSGKCIDVQGAPGTANGAVLQLWS